MSNIASIHASTSTGWLQLSEDIVRFRKINNLFVSFEIVNHQAFQMHSNSTLRVTFSDGTSIQTIKQVVIEQKHMQGLYWYR